MVHRSAIQLLVVALVFGAFSGGAWSDAVEPAGSRHWSLTPVRCPPTLTAPRPADALSPIDVFIDVQLVRQGLNPVPPAHRTTLLRRLSFDLIGLPPTLDELQALSADDAPDAIERQIDRWMASPRYGERWARPWLDLAHYADTDGYLTDQARPVAWRYRQWLVDALNRDQSFADFTIQQLAGDLLPDATLDQRLATGFLRNTLSNREGGADLEEYRVEQVVDRTQMVGTIWLGLTVGCCRCHDHKFDPLTQREFYQLYALLDGADEVNVDAPLHGEWEPYQARRPEYEQRRAELLAPVATGLAELQARWERRLLEAAANPGQDHVWDRQWEVLGLIWGGHLGEGQLEGTQIVRLDVAQRRPDERDRVTDYFLKQGSAIDAKQFAELKLGELPATLDKLAAEYPRLTRAPSIRESPIPRSVCIHERGDFRTPGERVQGGVPSVLPPLPAGEPLNRLTLARWLVREDHPLTTRVVANRAWQEFFGRGLVFTLDDFGVHGDAPSHPELLDWLACRLRESDWSMKTLHRQIVSSAAYRRSTVAPRAVVDADPTNRWVARQAPLHLSADQIRDTTLAVSELLDERIGGASVFPPQPASVVSEAFDNTWKPSGGGNRYRRGLYTYLQRLSQFAQQVTFDAPSLSRSCARRERSNTPLQALALLNDPTAMDAAAGLAARVLAALPDASRHARIERLFQWGLARGPSGAERQRFEALFDEQLRLLRDDPAAVEQLVPTTIATGQPAEVEPAAGPAWLRRLEAVDRTERAAWALAASVVLNLHEFVTRP